MKKLRQQIAEDSKWCGEFLQQGMTASLELVKNKNDKARFPFENRMGYKIYLEALKRGVFLRPLGDVIYFIPPLVINEDEITKIADVELDVIGINNRNLHTLKTDINHCLHIRDKYTDQLSRFNIVAESGFSEKRELEMYKTNGIDLFLIGESLLKGKL